eukprot:2947482-Amphidinium_carterae.1
MSASYHCQGMHLCCEPAAGVPFLCSLVFFSWPLQETTTENDHDVCLGNGVITFESARSAEVGSAIVLDNTDAVLKSTIVGPMVQSIQRGLNKERKRKHRYYQDQLNQ